MTYNNVHTYGGNQNETAHLILFIIYMHVTCNDRSVPFQRKGQHHTLPKSEGLVKVLPHPGTGRANSASVFLCLSPRSLGSLRFLLWLKQLSLVVGAISAAAGPGNENGNNHNASPPRRPRTRPCMMRRWFGHSRQDLRSAWRPHVPYNDSRHFFRVRGEMSEFFSTWSTERVDVNLNQGIRDDERVENVPRLSHRRRSVRHPQGGNGLYHPRPCSRRLS